MPRIGLLSDTHGWLDPRLKEHFAACDQIWHAGDIGGLDVADELARWKPLRAVYGNIDDTKTRITHPEHQRFTLDGVKVWITHIAGRPPRYDRKVIDDLRTFGQVSDPHGAFGHVSDRSGREADPRSAQRTSLFICGHTHLCTVKYDEKLNFLYMNPGAAGKQGFHHVRTALRFSIESGVLKNLEVIELGSR